MTSKQVDNSRSRGSLPGLVSSPVSSSSPGSGSSPSSSSSPRSGSSSGSCCWAPLVGFVVGLIPAILGMMSLYNQNQTESLFHTYQAWIALNLISILLVRKNLPYFYSSLFSCSSLLLYFCFHYFQVKDAKTVWIWIVVTGVVFLFVSYYVSRNLMR